MIKSVIYFPFTANTIGSHSIIAGILQKDYARVAISVEMLRETFENVEIFDGFYEDGSFIQHEIYGYIGLRGWITNGYWV